jgi:proteasome lid subunit RPN8/RPN11
MIQLPQHIADAIVRHAREELPNEACGLLTGTAEGLVRKQFPMTNTDHSPEHFSFDPHEQLRVLKEARRLGQKIIANYHSHPSSPARPSDEDVRLAFDPAIVYIILSLAAETPSMNAFHLVDGAMQPCKMQIT